MPPLSTRSAGCLTRRAAESAEPDVGVAGTAVDGTQVGFETPGRTREGRADPEVDAALVGLRQRLTVSACAATVGR